MNLLNDRGGTMDEKKEESLDILRAIKEKAEADLKNKPGYEKCKVINVIHYTKKVELINRATEKKKNLICV